MFSYGSWKHVFQVRAHQTWLWSLSLEVLRLGEVEAHVQLPLNWARIASSSGTLRPQARTTSRRGRVLTAGDYRIQVRERIATLSELGVLHKLRAPPRMLDRPSPYVSGRGDSEVQGQRGLPGDGCFYHAAGTCDACAYEASAYEASNDGGLAEAEAKKFAELDAYAKHIAAQLKVCLNPEP